MYRHGKRTKKTQGVGVQEGSGYGAEAIPHLRAARCWLVPGGQYLGALPGGDRIQLPHLCSCLPLQPPRPRMLLHCLPTVAFQSVFLTC